MVTWSPAQRDFVELATQLPALSPALRARWGQIAVPMRAVPIANDPGHMVFVIAQFNGQVIYFEEVEEGWNVASLDSVDGIMARGFEQDDLLHAVTLLPGREDVA
jgi:hypothetical protein